MDVSLYQSAAAMNATERWQDMIADNLVSSSVPGSRQKSVSFSAIEAGTSARNGGTTYVIPSVTTAISFSQGELHQAGPMDFALEGKGFFTVQTADGQKGYTRDGEFGLNSKGQLVTKQGYQVLGTNGPLQFDLKNASPINISAAGDISQGVDSKGKIQITGFRNAQLLTQVNGGYFIADNPTVQPQPDAKTTVHQGFVEAANTSPATQMSQLITAMRMFEMNQKVMQMQNERMGRTITDLSGNS